jgi:mediator of RNA polymerase II transcription subunit 18
MYEVFLSSVISEKDFPSMCAVLCGLCEAPQPWKTIERVLYYQGPALPAGLSKRASIDQVALRQDKANADLWNELHVATSRQSYLLTARYELTKEQFGPSVPPMDFNAMKGILRFSDFPDPPPPSKPLLLQRKIVELWEQKNLLAVLKDNGYM